MRGVRLYRQALPGSLFRRLVARARRDGRALHRRWSYWYDAGRPPALLTEHIIVALRRMARPGAACVGAEWWFQVRYPNRVKKFHFDTDSQLYRDRGVLEHPMVASVLYLDRIGGPTMVVDQTIDRRGETMTPATPTCGALVEPRPNQYLVFPGALRHGVYPAPREGQWRITFLVNWWHRQPGEPLCRSRPSARDREIFGVSRPPPAQPGHRPRRAPVSEFEVAR